MCNDQIFSSMSFTILGLQVAFGVESNQLKMKINPSGCLKPSQLVLNRMSTQPSAIQFSVSQFSPTQTLKKTSLTNSSLNNCYQNVNLRLQEKIASLENTIKFLQQKFISKSQSRRELKKISSPQERYGQSGSKNNLYILTSAEIPKNEEYQYKEIILQQAEQNAKLQLLNTFYNKRSQRKSRYVIYLKRYQRKGKSLFESWLTSLLLQISKKKIFSTNIKRFCKIMCSIVWNKHQANIKKMKIIFKKLLQVRKDLYFHKFQNQKLLRQSINYLSLKKTINKQLLNDSLKQILQTKDKYINENIDKVFMIK